MTEEGVARRLDVRAGVRRGYVGGGGGGDGSGDGCLRRSKGRGERGGVSE
jgi:hypothetical protein